MNYFFSSRNIEPAHFKDLKSCWINVLNEIERRGKVLNTEYGNQAKCLFGVVAEMDSVGNFHPEDGFCSPEKIELYKKQLTRSAEKREFEYTYIDRFTGWGKESLDQPASIKKYVDGQGDLTNGLWMITWVPEIDQEKQESQPCLQSVYVYPYDDGTADFHIKYRSWDWFRASESNIIAITEMGKTELLDPNGYEMGKIRIFGDNVHMYDNAWGEATRVVNSAKNIADYGLNARKTFIHRFENSEYANKAILGGIDSSGRKIGNEKNILGIGIEIDEIDTNAEPDINKYGGVFSENGYLGRQSASVSKNLSSGRRDTKRLQILSWEPSKGNFSKKDEPLQRIWFYPHKNNGIDVHIDYRNIDARTLENDVQSLVHELDKDIFKPNGMLLNATRILADRVYIKD